MRLLPLLFLICSACPTTRPPEPATTPARQTVRYEIPYGPNADGTAIEFTGPAERVSP